MRVFIIILLEMSLTGICLAQEGSYCLEIFFRTVNTSSATFKFNAHSYEPARWDVFHHLTSLYQDDTLTIDGDYSNCHLGFTFGSSCGDNPILAFTKYTIKVVEPEGFDAQIVIDATGCDFSGGDLYLSYYANLDLFKQDLGCSNFGDDIITYYQSYSDTDCLELFLTLSNQNGHPYLEWNPYHDTNILGYNVYRKVTTSSGTQTYIEFTTDTFYTDFVFTIDPKNGDDLVEYWIKAKKTSTQESLESNHRDTEGISQIQWKEIPVEENVVNDFNPGQNYPNPFNPTTITSYEIPKASQVEIKVFDILGDEIATLVNERKESGTYEVEFNAEGLPSGMYFYSIAAGKFHQAEKMILLR